MGFSYDAFYRSPGFYSAIFPRVFDVAFAATEQGIRELDIKYGKVCHKLSYNIVNDKPVSVSKGGVVQEPDRTITLQQDNETWKVINEGY